MQTSFTKYAQRGNAILTELAAELNMPKDKKRAMHNLRAVLHALRNRVTPHESVQFISQLPMMLKALYVDGWQMGKKQHRVSSFHEFVDEVYDLGGGYRGLAFGDRMEAVRAIEAVFKVLKQFISEGEFNDMLANMPEDLRSPLLDMLMRKGGLVL